MISRQAQDDILFENHFCSAIAKFFFPGIHISFYMRVFADQFMDFISQGTISWTVDKNDFIQLYLFSNCW